jgi:hypothetical protein
MTEKQMRKLSRAELLELLLEQTQELEQVRAERDSALEQLAQREILLSNAGSIAQAALQLNHVFEAAEAAGQQYVDSLKALYEREAKKKTKKPEKKGGRGP